MSKFDGTTLNISHRKSLTGLHDYTAGLATTKNEERKTPLLDPKLKQYKKSKSKHFKLLKKRNLNSKIAKELKLTDLTRFSPNRSKLVLKKKHGFGL